MNFIPFFITEKIMSVVSTPKCSAFISFDEIQKLDTFMAFNNAICFNSAMIVDVFIGTFGITLYSNDLAPLYNIAERMKAYGVHMNARIDL